MGITRPIDAQRRLAPLGEIRIGEKAKNSAGVEYPRKLKFFRFTSRHKHLLEKLQEVYGGEVRPWANNPGKFELMSKADSIAAYFSVKDVGEGDTESISRSYEHRDKDGKLMRKCDGQSCLTWKGKERVPVPCICDHEGQQLCKIMSRVLVILPDVADLGAWTMRTGSSNFDAEVEAFIENFKQMAPDMSIVPVRMTITHRHKETAPNQPSGNYPVVVLSRDHAPKPMAQLAAEIKAQLYAPVPMALGEVPVAQALPPSSEIPATDIGTDESTGSGEEVRMTAPSVSDDGWMIERIGVESVRDVKSALGDRWSKFAADARSHDASKEQIKAAAEKALIEVPA